MQLSTASEEAELLICELLGTTLGEALKRYRIERTVEAKADYLQALRTFANFVMQENTPPIF